MVTDERLEAVLAEPMDMSDELGADGEIAGAAEKRFGGGAETFVALGDLDDGVSGEMI